MLESKPNQTFGRAMLKINDVEMLESNILEILLPVQTFGRIRIRISQTNKKFKGGRHSSVVLSAPTILQPRVQIPSTPSTLFSICIEIVTRKE